MTPRGPWSRRGGLRCLRALEVRVVQESTDTIYLVLPFASAVGEGGEISDRELEAVAGGDSFLLYPNLSSGLLFLIVPISG